jgi:hypothetical protein
MNLGQVEGRRLVCDGDKAITNFATREVIENTKKGFLKNLVESNHFIYLTPLTLTHNHTDICDYCYKDDIIFVHIQPPQKELYCSNKEDYILNPDPHYKISVFSEGIGVIPQTSIIEVRNGADWEMALQEVLGRF